MPTTSVGILGFGAKIEFYNDFIIIVYNRFYAVRRFGIFLTIEKLPERFMLSRVRVFLQKPR